MGAPGAPFPFHLELIGFCVPGDLHIPSVQSTFRNLLTVHLVQLQSLRANFFCPIWPPPPLVSADPELLFLSPSSHEPYPAQNRHRIPCFSDALVCDLPCRNLLVQTPASGEVLTVR